MLFTRRVVERELQIVEGSKLLVRQESHAEAVGGHGQLDVPAPQERQHLAKLRMHAVLAGAEVHRVHGEPVEHRSDLFLIETIRARGVPIAERA